MLFRRRSVAVSDDPPGHFNIPQQRDRAADELIGICRGILFDGVVSKQEAEQLLDWIERHARFSDTYPFNHLYVRLREALIDGVLDADEEADLLDALVGLAGGESKVLPEQASLSATLPLCSPPPQLVFDGQTYVVTGTFVYGTRANVVRAIEQRGGQVAASITVRTNFLVIGEIGSQAWRHSSYGRKIEKAVQYREAGRPVRIVSEGHWRTFITE